MSERRTANDREPTSSRRPLWKGTVAFGLVSIPVSLRRAVARRQVRFHELHGHDGGRIRRRAVCSLDGAAVAREHIVQGDEVERGRWVTVTADELPGAEPVGVSRRSRSRPSSTRTTSTQSTTSGRTGSSPTKGARWPYAVLAAALERAGRVAVARFTMRTRRHLAVIRPTPRADAGRPRSRSRPSSSPTRCPPAQLGAPGAPAPG